MFILHGPAGGAGKGGDPAVRREKNQYIFASEAHRHHWARRIRTFLLLLIPLLAATALVGNFLVSRRVTFEELRLTVLNLPEDLEQYSILHLSDLHGARYGESQKAIRTAIGSARYSCVVMTGDMLGDGGDVEPLLELIALMPKDTPKYYIPGDMDGDYLASRAHSSLSVFADWAIALQEAGVTILDRPVGETRGKGTIWFVPEELYTVNLDNLEEVYRKQLESMNARAAALTPDDAARIRVLEYELARIAEIRETEALFGAEDIQVVLTHTPLTEEYINSVISWAGKEKYFSMRYASLILAGHYNGGQWRIPLVGAVYVPELGWFPPDEEVQGLSYPDGIPQYISPGLGSDPHFERQPGRLFNSPTVTRITLTRYAR